MEKVEVPASPGRLINAVANIGYDPEVAICDLMDNSIDADASLIALRLVARTEETEGDADTIDQYIIADDGVGMDRATLVKAFTLGTERVYPPHSLGKFGLGLKSAGLSLGSRITLITKTESASEPLCAILTLRDIEQSGRYEIDLGAPTGTLLELWGKYGPKRHGTVLLLDQLNENQPPYTRFHEYIRRYCSLVYHMFMEDKARSLSISVNGDPITATDPLFMKEAQQNGPLEALAWNGQTVHLLLDNTDLHLDSASKCTIAATHLVHPPSFETEGKRIEMRDKYGIESDPYTRRPRHGFYVYRNHRIIVMAERFHGLVSSATQAWSFRSRLMFDESADAILSLDVKKRHCQLPKVARNNLRSLISTYQRKSVEAWEKAGEKEAERRKITKDTVANRSITDAPAPVASLDYAPGADLSSDAAIAARKEQQQAISREALQSIQDPAVSAGTLEARAKDKSVVSLVQGLKANAMWLAFPAVQLGVAETLVNKAHSWIAAAYAAAEKEPGIAIALHQLFTILARGELEVRSTNWRDLPSDAVDKVFERFRRKTSAIAEDLADSLAVALEQDTGPEEQES